MTLPSPRRRTFRAEAFITVLSRVTCPSPAMTVFPSRRTQRMVVPWNMAGPLTRLLRRFHCYAGVLPTEQHIDGARPAVLRAGGGEGQHRASHASTRKPPLHPLFEDGDLIFRVNATTGDDQNAPVPRQATTV